MRARQEPGKPGQRARYRYLEPQRPHRRIAVDLLRGELVSLPPRFGSQLLPYFLANRLIGV